MLVVYADREQEFRDIEELLYSHQCIVSGDINDPWWKDSTVCFDSDKFVEIVGKKIMFGVCNHYYSYWTDTYEKALREGEKIYNMYKSRFDGKLSGNWRADIDEVDAIYSNLDLH